MKHDATGRSKGSRFARLDHNLLDSPAYRSLSPNARALLVELVMMENGRNNGELFLSVRDAADRMGVADTAAAMRAFAELEKMGFIACTRDGHFAVKASEGSRARCWRLTWQSTPCLRIGPTCDFRERRPEPESRANRRMIAGCEVLKRYRKVQSSGKLPVVNFATPTPKRAEDSTTDCAKAEAVSVPDSATPFPENGGNPSLRIARDSATHTAYQLGAKPSQHPASGPLKAREAGCDGATSRQCGHCGNSFDLTPADRRFPRRFCSDACWRAAQVTRSTTTQQQGDKGMCPQPVTKTQAYGEERIANKEVGT